MQGCSSFAFRRKSDQGQWKWRGCSPGRGGCDEWSLPSTGRVSRSSFISPKLEPKCGPVVWRLRSSCVEWKPTSHYRRKPVNNLSLCFWNKSNNTKSHLLKLVKTINYCTCMQNWMCVIKYTHAQTHEVEDTLCCSKKLYYNLKYIH